MVTAMEQIPAFVARCDAYRQRRVPPISRATLGNLLFNDARRIDAIEAGGDIGVRRLARAEANLAVMEKALEPEPASGCGYTGYEFGASYPDSTCIDGFLWDLDSCDEPGGGLTCGGDIACPKCNPEGTTS